MVEFRSVTSLSNADNAKFAQVQTVTIVLSCSWAKVHKIWRKCKEPLVD